MKGKHKIGWKTAAALVISNMIGTGVFTSLGYQLTDIQNTWSIVLIWLLGGLFALIGALTYAELGTNFDDSGGDYVFLSKLIHPIVGYIYAWVSLTVGFSAPIAISVMAMKSYLNPINPTIFNDWFGILVILILTAIHSISVGQSGKFQNISTGVKIGFVLILIILGFSFVPTQDVTAIDLSNSWQDEILLPGFAVSLLYVTYAYTGWNSAAYIVDEIDDARRNLPKALLFGTALVTIIYVLLQVVFLKHASVDQLSGKVEVAFISFKNIFGTEGGNWVSYLIAIQLIATVSGYLWIGSRITFAMAKDHSFWRKIAVKNKNGIPVRALWLQAGISIVLTLTGTFEQVLLYASFLLQLMGTLTVASIFWLKGRKGAFKSPLKPFLQIVFVVFSIWILGYMLMEKPKESAIGLLFVLTGIVTYFFSNRTNKQ
ncbi:amino acid permease [Polaribacter undariae]|uniref:Amino acid permease n=1 Tax=Polaribacter sejongensis TaxID=985043 RepID=A0AAJ1QYW1_9FLAO|nr:amino acid permease [Polaribacter undariae]MDN3620655.1 amino acid permease [Polaribacter undariae]UWD32471.1 amino acid permease [Polaribacter undariae]